MFARGSKIIAALALLFLLVAATPALADEMASLHIDVALQADGSGIVTETRDMTLSKGTEIYIPMNDEAGTELSAFTVQENGVPFSERTPWNVDAGRESKTGYYGINQVTGGYELCWGIGEYGRHTYTVQYRLSGMVRQLEDGQSMYWKLFNEDTNLPPKQLRVTVSGPVPFTAEDTLIWGFGFPGEVHLENGKLVGTATEALTSSHKVILLMQFKQPFFQTAVQNPMTMAEQQEQAKKGSSFVVGVREKIGILALAIGPFVSIAGAYFIIRILLLRRTKGSKKRRQHRATLRRNKDKYYRDIPYGGHITDVAYPLSEIGLCGLERYFNAYLLKWLKEERVRHVPVQAGIIRKKEVSTIQLLNQERMDRDVLEGRLWNMMLDASGKDFVLESDEFTAWAKDNRDRIESWVKALDRESQKMMEQHGYISVRTQKHFGIIPSTKLRLNEQGDALIDRMAQHYNYLKDYTLLSDRSADHVGLWEDMLVWAALYGIAEEVAKQFQKLDPEFFAERGLSYADIYMMNAFSHDFVSSYRTSSSFDSDASSGGGGFTSIGGGGGSFGGGSGGGSR